MIQKQSCSRKWVAWSSGVAGKGLMGGFAKMRTEFRETSRRWWNLESATAGVATPASDGCAEGVASGRAEAIERTALLELWPSVVSSGSCLPESRQAGSLGNKYPYPIFPPSDLYLKNPQSQAQPEAQQRVRRVDRGTRRAKQDNPVHLLNMCHFL